MNDPTANHRQPRWLDPVLYVVIGIIGFLGFCFAADAYPAWVRPLFWGVTLPSEAGLALVYFFLYRRWKTKNGHS